MKESNTAAGKVTTKQFEKVILLDTKGQYLKELDILAGNAAIKQLQKVLLLNTKESSTLG